MSDRVILAEHSGFCFGVKRATEQLEDCLRRKKENERVVTLGHLIHNEIYNRRMADRGVLTVETEDLAELIDGVDAEHPLTLLTRAHGITEATEALLRQARQNHPGLTVIDCTCPFVSKIHQIAEKHDSDAYLLILMGAAGHPEVEGIISRFRGEKYLFATSEDLEKALKGGTMTGLHRKTAVLAAQTTFRVDEWVKSQKNLKNLCTNSIIFDTICNVTESRQNEAAMLAQRCDGMIVIGGKASSNTAKLYAVCRQFCPDTVQIESLSGLPEDFRTTHQCVGIVAGASTPADIIEEVFKTMDQMEDFGAMLNAQQDATLNTGDVVTGTVTYVTDAEVQLDLGSSVTGIIKAEQFCDDPSVKLTEQVKAGDKVEAFVIRVSDIEGIAELSKKRADSDREWKTLAAAAENNEVLEGKVVRAIKGGVIVLVGANQIFVPASQSGVARDGDLNSIVGNEVKVKVLEVKGPKKVVGSISRVLREERKAKEAAFWDTIEEGKTYTGPVKSMTSYGAFVDLGGVDGMVHMSELSWKRISNPAQVLSIGQVITVFVKSFDKEKKRVSLGYKTEDTNPWFIFTSQYAVGDVAQVKIVSMTPFGAFAEIVDGVDGLIHISQISNKRIGKPQDVLEIGQVVDAKIINIDNEKQKVSLSMRALLEDAPVEEAPVEG